MEHRPAARHDRDDRHRRVMESVWRWQSPPHRPVTAPPRRLTGAVVRDLVIGLAIAGALYAAGRSVIAGVAAAIAVAVFVVRGVLPSALSSPLVAISARAAHRVGHALSTLVLGAVYFTVFVLLRAWRDSIGHDALRLKRRGRDQSFWIDRSTLPETSPDKPY